MEASTAGDASHGEESDESDDRKPAAVESGDGGSSTTRKRKGKSDKNNHQTRWDEMYLRLCDYHKRFGNASVPNRYADDPQLGSWVSAQRRAYKTITSGSTGSTAMTLDRAAKLKQLGFEWEALNPNNVPWDTRYSELLSFVKKYGHANVPMRWKENVQLSNWVSKQRHDYKLLQRGTSSRLTEQRKKLLNDIGFIWEVERGSSIAQSQRVLVMGAPSAQTNRGAAEFVDSRNTGPSTPLRSLGTEEVLPSDRDGIPSAVETASGVSITAASTSPAVLDPTANNVGSATAAAGVSEMTNRQLGYTNPSPIPSNANSLESRQVSQLAQNAIGNRSLLSNLNTVGGIVNFQGVNPLSTHNAPTSTHQSQNPMLLLPFLAMMPQFNPGSASAPAFSFPNPHSMPLPSHFQGLNTNNAAPNAMSALSSLLGGNAGAHSPLNTISLATLLAGSGVNTANFLGTHNAASSYAAPPPDPYAVANLQASLITLAAALGGGQQPHASPPMATAPLATTPIGMALNGAIAPQVALPDVGVNQIHVNANLASLSAFLNTAAGVSSPGQQLAASTMASVLTGNTHPFAAASTPFAAPAASHAPQPPDVAGALASTLSRFFDNNTQQLQAPSLPPAPSPTDAAQNLATALSQFFQSNPSNPPINRNTDTDTRHIRDRGGGNSEKDDPPEKRTRRS